VTTFEKSSYFSHWAGNPLQCDHSRNPFRVLFILSGRSPGTIRPLAKPFSRFILHRAGRLEQLDHSWNFSRSFIIGQVAQNNLVHFFKKQKHKKNNSKKKKRSSSKWLVSWFQHLSVKVICQSPVFKVFKKKNKKKVGHLPNDLFLDFYISL
jgi:hypothetical protein